MGLAIVAYFIKLNLPLSHSMGPYQVKPELNAPITNKDSTHAEKITNGAGEVASRPLSFSLVPICVFLRGDDGRQLCPCGPGHGSRTKPFPEWGSFGQSSPRRASSRRRSVRSNTRVGEQLRRQHAGAGNRCSKATIQSARISLPFSMVRTSAVEPGTLPPVTGSVRPPMWMLRNASARALKSIRFSGRAKPWPSSG